MKVFGSIYYVTTDNEGAFYTPDVKPFELYLQLVVKSQWDWNINDFFLVFNGGFTYYVVLASKRNNKDYEIYKKLKKEEITEEYQEAINKFLENR